MSDSSVASTMPKDCTPSQNGQKDACSIPGQTMTSSAAIEQLQRAEVADDGPDAVGRRGLPGGRAGRVVAGG